MVTDRAARTLRIEEQYGLEPGKPASFVLLPVSDVQEALRVQPVCRYVFSQGFQIAETIPSRTLLYSGGQARAVNRYTIFKEGRAGESEPDNSR
jgi:cytosine deaminase